MINLQTTASKQKQLEDRTANFGSEVLIFCRTIKLDTISQPVVSQIVRSSTSIGANYQEATAASSKRDFRHKIFICKKEAQETRHWLKMLLTLFPEEEPKLNELGRECQEFVLIFQSITSTLRDDK